MEWSVWAEGKNAFKIAVIFFSIKNMVNLKSVCIN